MIRILRLFESLDERATRLSAELGTVSNRPGRSRSYEENRTFVFSCLKVEKDVLESCEERERPKLKEIAVEVAALMGYDRAFGQELMANWRLDKTILVHETQERGKGSPGYANGSFVDTARRLAPAHLKAIEEFRRTCHAEGGVCSVRTVVQHLNTLFYADGSLVSPPPAAAAAPAAQPEDHPERARVSSQIETFWGCGKNHAAFCYKSKRTMRDAVAQIRAAWYGAPAGSVGAGGGSAPRKKAVRCKGLINKAIQEAQQMIDGFKGLGVWGICGAAHLKTVPPCCSLDTAGGRTRTTPTAGTITSRSGWRRRSAFTSPR